MSHTKAAAALKAAVPITIPIFFAFSLLGIGAGLYATNLHLPAWLPVLMSITIYTGTLEFIVASMLVSPTDPILCLTVSLLVSARHIFYSISMIDRYRGQGLKTFYLIFGLCDETFSLNAGTSVPDGIDAGWYYFFVTLLNQIYWAFGVSIGSLAGTSLPINTKGVEFVMCAMFVAIFVERLMGEKNHVAALVGLMLTAVSLAVFGSDHFLPPALLGMLLTLLFARPRLEPKLEEESALAEIESKA